MVSGAGELHKKQEKLRQFINNGQSNISLLESEEMK